MLYPSATCLLHLITLRDRDETRVYTCVLLWFLEAVRELHI